MNPANWTDDRYVDNSGGADWKQMDVNSAGVLAAGMPLSVGLGLAGAAVIYVVSGLLFFALGCIIGLVYYTAKYAGESVCDIWTRNATTLRRTKSGPDMRRTLRFMVRNFVLREVWVDVCWRGVVVDYYYNDLAKRLIAHLRKTCEPIVLLAAWMGHACLVVYRTTMAAFDFIARLCAPAKT